MKHWPKFIAFCQQELRTGGPDPQIATLHAVAARQKLTLERRIWLIGCYGAHHCVPSAIRVWEAWDATHALRKPRAFRRWLKQHWDELPVRPEMRSHRMLDKRTRCLLDFAAFSQRYSPRTYATYDDAWRGTQQDIKFYGRYMALKVLEMMSRFGKSPHLALPDMRAKGGWSPRRCLGLLWKQYPKLLDRKDESPKTIRLVEKIFQKTRWKLQKNDIRVSNFQLQVLLCEYREALHGGYYPGASLDEELQYATLSGTRKLATMFQARKDVFPRRYLGEANGWDGPRPEKFTPFKVTHEHR